MDKFAPKSFKLPADFLQGALSKTFYRVKNLQRPIWLSRMCRLSWCCLYIHSSACGSLSLPTAFRVAVKSVLNTAEETSLNQSDQTIWRKKWLFFFCPQRYLECISKNARHSVWDMWNISGGKNTLAGAVHPVALSVVLKSHPAPFPNQS